MTVAEFTESIGLRSSLTAGESSIERKALGYLSSVQGELAISCALEIGKVVRVGRDLSNDVVLDHPAVSASHCLIWSVHFDDKTKPIFFLKDTSLNGVFVNKALVGKDRITILEDEDLIDIKFATRLKFYETSSMISERYCVPFLLPASDWSITDKKLGYGTFGSVYVALNKREPGKFFAVKIIKSDFINTSAKQNRESTILQEINHPNVIYIYETIQNGHGQFFIFQDLICGGDLYSYLSSSGYFQPISETEAKIIMYQLFTAISYLHERSIIHRDLKLDNILMEIPRPYSRIFISDFGAAKQLPKPRTYTVIGTLEYCAPEVGLFNNKVSSKGYGKPCDMWSLGVILQIMLTGLSPFSGITDGEQFSQIADELHQNLDDASCWKGISNEVKSIISQLLITDHYKRLTSSQCISHNWISKHKEMLEISYQMILSKSAI